MPKRTVIIFAAAAFFGVAVPTQTAQAGDDMWDMMDPSWWYDEFFDDDNDKWWRRYRYNPYWGAPYGWYPPPQEPLVIHIQPEKASQDTEIERPE
jgi:hypothetical protein